MEYCLVSVLPENKSSKNAIADRSKALTYQGLSLMISDARSLFTELCSAQLDEKALRQKAELLLSESNLTCDKIVDGYCEKFKITS